MLDALAVFARFERFATGIFDLGAVVLGLILGHITEEGFGGALAISNGSPAIFFTRPICIVLWVCIALLLLSAIRAKKKAKKTVD